MYGSRRGESCELVHHEAATKSAAPTNTAPNQRPSEVWPAAPLDAADFLDESLEAEPVDGMVAVTKVGPHISLIMVAAAS